MKYKVTREQRKKGKLRSKFARTWTSSSRRLPAGDWNWNSLLSRQGRRREWEIVFLLNNRPSECSIDGDFNLNNIYENFIIIFHCSQKSPRHGWWVREERSELDCRFWCWWWWWRWLYCGRFLRFSLTWPSSLACCCWLCTFLSFIYLQYNFGISISSRDNRIALFCAVSYFMLHVFSTFFSRPAQSFTTGEHEQTHP